MANVATRVAQNVPGEYFVDATCIDCDACRQIAPEVFAEGNDTAFVYRQPTNAEEIRSAMHALVSCPTGSIGTVGQDDSKSVFRDFPLPVEPPVYYCGFNSPKSYGGNSYFIRREDGNWLVDSPKFVGPLVRRLEELGGVAHIFLTHRDDVADAARYARHFSARRAIHRLELSSQPDAEQIIDGDKPIDLSPCIAAIPTPGHTAGHMCLLVDGKYLFTGDHLAWDRARQRLTAFRDYCWHSWAEQTDSMERLAAYPFAWILPGHGQRIELAAVDMRRQMDALVGRMRQSAEN